MGNRALILGGGGPVGIAWELGLAAGLEESGVHIATADRIIGTSAGSFVGAALASGRPAEALVRAQVEQAQRDAAAPKGERRAAPDLGPLMKLMAGRPSEGTPPVEWLVEVGQFALAAKTITEEQFLGTFGSITKAGEAWPKGFACTAVDAVDGSFHVWEAASDVELGRAIASSCSVPGIYPPITIHGRRYVDGGMRSGTNFDLGKGYGKVLAVAVVGNLGLELMKARAKAEIATLRETGAQVELIIPDANCREAFGPNLMDASRRGDVALAGVVQGRAEAARIKAFWG